MKNWFILAVLLFAFNVGQAQVAYEVDEETRSMSEGVNHALVLSMEMTDVKLAEDHWSDYLKDYGSKPKKVKGSDELLSDDADIPGIGAGNTVDVYVTFEEVGNNVDVTVWFNLGGAYLNSKDHPSRFEDAMRFLDRYVLSVSKDVVKEELKLEEDRLKDLEKELDKLEKEKSKFEDDIAEAEERIRQAKADIKENESEQTNRQREIENQNKVIEAVKKRLKDLD
ncbi:MAG: hypothetical protein GYB31_03180 [Bacteroidetes bacterium]|nr:hypothetical protein [Bacteroidota bacterium]